MVLALLQAAAEDDDIDLDRGDIVTVILVLVVILCIVAIVYYLQRINRGP